MDRDGTEHAKRTRESPINNMASGAKDDAKSMVNGVKPLPQVDGSMEVQDASAAHRTELAHLQNPSSIGQVIIPESLVASWEQLPPELQRYEDGFLPLSKLIERVAQDCYNGIEATIDDLASIRGPQKPSAPQVNGIGHQSAVKAPAPLTSEDIRKRTTLMNFAHDQRDKLIKLMVLTQWSRKVGDLSKLISINAWLNNQFAAHDWAPHWIGMVKQDMNRLKQNNPDIGTALQVLTTGRAPWMPHVSTGTILSRQMADSSS
jgi:mediator of RNA polymerase II transcription subunit 14